MKKLDFIFPVEGYCKTTNERVLTYIKCKTKKKLYSGGHSDPAGIAWNSEGWWDISEGSSKPAYSEKYFLDYLTNLDKPYITTTNTCVAVGLDHLEMRKSYGVQIINSTESWITQETTDRKIKAEYKLLNSLPITNYNINKIKCQNSKKILKFF